MLQVRPVSTTEYGSPCQAVCADPSAATTPPPPAPPPLFLPSPCSPGKPALPLFLQQTHWPPSSCSPNLPDSKRRRSAKKVWFGQPMPAAQLNSCPSAHILEYCKTITVQSVKGKIGFSISGEKPCIVVAVKPEGPGYFAGVRLNQIIVNKFCTLPPWHR